LHPCNQDEAEGRLEDNKFEALVNRKSSRSSSAQLNFAQEKLNSSLDKKNISFMKPGARAA